MLSVNHDVVEILSVDMVKSLQRGLFLYCRISFEKSIYLVADHFFKRDNEQSSSNQRTVCVNFI